MTKSKENMPGKLNREDIITMAARKAGTTIEDMTEYMEAIESSIREAALAGKTVSLMRFGTFYVQRHGGHPVQFTGGKGDKVSSYLVYKFSAAAAFNEELRRADAVTPIPAVSRRPSR